MTSPDGQPPANPPGDDDEDEIAPTPFDNPFFLPVILAGFSLWLFYDGYFNAEFIQRNLEEGDQFAIDFNRWGGPILGVLALWFTGKAFRARDQDSSQD